MLNITSNRNVCMYYTDSVSQWVSQVIYHSCGADHHKPAERFSVSYWWKPSFMATHTTQSHDALNDIKVWVVFYRKLCFFTAAVKKNRNLESTTKSIKVLISEVGCDMWIHWLITVSADWTENIQPNTGNLISVCLTIRITVISVAASPRAQCLWTLTFTLEADETLAGLQFLTELNWIAGNAD